MMRRFDAVLFDLDGTLVDSAPDLAGAANEQRVARAAGAAATKPCGPMSARAHAACWLPPSAAARATGVRALRDFPAPLRGTHAGGVAVLFERARADATH
jgi:phosphoglycolate phosphatase-like HAD superfamily hydrolase